MTVNNKIYIEETDVQSVLVSIGFPYSKTTTTSAFILTG